MSSNHRFRFAIEADVDRVKAIAKQHEKEIGFLTTGMLRTMIRDNKCVLIEQDASIVGFCNFNFRRDRIAVIYEIAIDAAHQGSGLGGKLLRGFCELAKRKRCYMVRLKVIEGTPANRFYDRHGFKVIGTEASKRTTLLVMVKSLVGSQ